MKQISTFIALRFQTLTGLRILDRFPVNRSDLVKPANPADLALMQDRLRPCIRIFSKA